MTITPTGKRSIDMFKTSFSAHTSDKGSRNNGRSRVGYRTANTSPKSILSLNNRKGDSVEVVPQAIAKINQKLSKLCASLDLSDDEQAANDNIGFSDIDTVHIEVAKAKPQGRSVLSGLMKSHMKI